MTFDSLLISLDFSDFGILDFQARDIPGESLDRLDNLADNPVDHILSNNNLYRNTPLTFRNTRSDGSNNIGAIRIDDDVPASEAIYAVYVMVTFYRLLCNNLT